MRDGKKELICPRCGEPFRAYSESILKSLLQLHEPQCPFKKDLQDEFVPGLKFDLRPDPAAKAQKASEVQQKDVNVLELTNRDKSFLRCLGIKVEV